jgi:UDP-N-acetylmuramoyl-tripeptide--D-alanyl-D-alanine ligase
MMFVALRGENFDGNRYAKSALEQGCRYAVVDNAAYADPADERYLLVDDSLKALQQLARHHRRTLGLPIVGITGTNGKTTTKELVAAVLSRKYHIHYTQGNLNNHIGVPLTLLQLTAEHEMAVVEMGMNHMGEINYLTRMANPDVAVISNIGDAHIENLGSRENTLRAKSEIFNGMGGKGVAVLNGDDSLLRTLEGQLDQQILWYGAGEVNDFRCMKLDEGFDDHMIMDAKAPQGSWSQYIPSLGSYMIYSVLSAAAVGSWFGMTTDEIRKGVISFVPTKMRMEILRRNNNITILNDTYNANPQSMRSAVDTLSKMPAQRRVAVLGDMLELGSLGPVLHEGVGRFVGEKNIDILITVGELAENICVGAGSNPQTECYARPNKDEAKAVLEQVVTPGTVVLFKASRGVHMEELVEFLKEMTQEI